MKLIREPKVITTGARAICAAIAVLAATGIVASIVALAGHHGEEAPAGEQGARRRDGRTALGTAGWLGRACDPVASAWAGKA